MFRTSKTLAASHMVGKTQLSLSPVKIEPDSLNTFKRASSLHVAIASILNGRRFASYDKFSADVTGAHLAPHTPMSKLGVARSGAGGERGEKGEKGVREKDDWEWRKR